MRRRGRANKQSELSLIDSCWSKLLKRSRAPKCTIQSQEANTLVSSSARISLHDTDRSNTVHAHGQLGSTLPPDLVGVDGLEIGALAGVEVVSALPQQGAAAGEEEASRRRAVGHFASGVGSGEVERGGDAGLRECVSFVVA